MKKTAVLNMRALNRVNVFKECFMGYLGAGMLEPIMAIASADHDPTGKDLIINLAQLFGLFAWLYLLTDAFDISDTQQSYVYFSRIDKPPPWLTKGKYSEANEIRGSFTRDLSLWSMLMCSAAAFCGVVAHRDVVHSHAIIFLWIILHHQARQATAWRGTGYFHTLLTPSTALLPLEYCLNLIDQEMIGDVDDLAAWRDFIKRESGVELTIEH